MARHGFWYAGGSYVGELGENKEATMGGAMYVEVMVPRQIRSPYPIVFVHGAGQTGVDWLQTPDGRPGWAYNFLDPGYVVYMTDFPARRRSQYVPGVDGNLTIRTAENLEEIFTAAAERGNFPQARRHTAWPGRWRSRSSPSAPTRCAAGCRWSRRAGSRGGRTSACWRSRPTGRLTGCTIPASPGS